MVIKVKKKVIIDKTLMNNSWVRAGQGIGHEIYLNRYKRKRLFKKKVMGTWKW